MRKQLLSILGILSVSAAVAQTTLVSESFTGQVQPVGWTNDSLGQAATWLWQFTNPGTRVITGAGFDADFAILDSDFMGSGNQQNASLTTPSFSTVGFTQVNLVFSESFRSYAGSNHDLDYTTDGGLTWTSLRTGTANIGYPNPAVQTTISLPAGALNQANVKIKFTYIGDFGYWWAIDAVSVLGLNNCTGTPPAGTITGCPASVCPSVPYDMTLSGASLQLGVSYQWFSSTDGITYAPIAGATTTTYHDSTATTPIYYQAVSTCSFGGSPSTSPSVSVTSLNSPINCYCVPENPTCAFDYISDVVITGTSFANAGTTCSNAVNGAYSTYPATGSTTASLEQGLAYNFDVTVTDDEIISVWIDFNQNGDFETTEWTQICTTSAAGIANSASVTVPPTALLGLTGMRVRSRLAGNTNDATSACLAMGSGETEDYKVTIIAPVGMKENSKSYFTLAPNPAKNTVTIALKTSGVNSVVSVTDILGKTVLDKMETMNSVVELNISSLVDGVYMVTITNEFSSTVKKLVVSK